MTTPTATLINSSVPKKRVSRRHASHAGAMPQRLHHGDEEREPHRHRDEQEVVDARERELDPCQVDVHDGSHADVSGRQLALDDPALLSPEGGRGPRAQHGHAPSGYAAEVEQVHAQVGRERERPGQLEAADRADRPPAADDRERPLVEVLVRRGRARGAGGDPVCDVTRLLDRDRRQPGQRLPVGPRRGRRRRRSRRSPGVRAGRSRRARRAARRDRARPRWPRRARRRTAPRARRRPR